MRARNGVEVAHGQAGQLINGALPISQSNAAGVKKGGLLSHSHSHYETEEKGYIGYVCRSLRRRQEPHRLSTDLDAPRLWPGFWWSDVGETLCIMK